MHLTSLYDPLSLRCYSLGRKRSSQEKEADRLDLMDLHKIFPEESWELVFERPDLNAVEGESDVLKRPVLYQEAVENAFGASELLCDELLDSVSTTAPGLDTELVAEERCEVLHDKGGDVHDGVLGADLVVGGYCF